MLRFIVHALSPQPRIKRVCGVLAPFSGKQSLDTTVCILGVFITTWLSLILDLYRTLDRLVNVLRNR